MNFKKTTKSIKNFFLEYWRKWIIVAFLAILIGIGFIFYKYIYVPLYGEKEVSPFKLEIKKTAYQEIMNKYLGKEQEINRIFNKNYLDPFK